MPNITPYYQRTQVPSPGAAPNVAVKPVDMSGLIRGAKELGVFAQSANEEKGKAWAIDALSQARLQWTSHLYERQASADPSGEGFTQKYINDFNQYADKIVAAAPTEYAKEYTKERMYELRTLLGERAMAFEAQTRIQWRQQRFESAISNGQKLMNIDPSQFDVVLAEQLAVIDAAALPPEHRHTMRQKAIEDIAYAAVWSQVNKDPAKFLDSIKMESWGAKGVGPVPAINNPDGSISTERTITVETAGEFHLIPTIVNGQQLDDDTAVDMWSKGAIQSLKVSNSEAEIEKYAKERSTKGGALGVVGDPNARSAPGGLHGVTGNKPFDILPFNKRLQMLSEALSLKNRLDSDADRLAERERKKMADDAMKEAWFRLDNNNLDKSYVEQIRPLISDSEYRSLHVAMKEAAGGAGEGVKSDPDAFRLVQQGLYHNPAQAKATALRLHREGRLSNSDLSSALTKGNELERTGGPKTEYERTRARITGNLDPGPFVQDPIGRGRLAEALYAFDTWAEIQSRGNTHIPDKEIAKRGEEIINQYRFINLSETAAGLPKPRFGDVRRNPGDPAGMQADIARAWAATKKAYDAKKISKDEYLEESRILNQWLRLTQETK